MKNKIIYIPKSVIESTLSQPKTTGKKLLQFLNTNFPIGTLPFNILEDVLVDNLPEIHYADADYWYCLEGEVEFIVGGKIVDPKFCINSGTLNELEVRGRMIEGGTMYKLRVGDILYIPPGEAHLHRTKTSARLLIIKIPEKTT